MKQTLGNKSADAFYLDEECSNEASSNFDTDEDDLDEHDYLNNENSLEENSAIKLELTKISGNKSNKSNQKKKVNKKTDYLKKRKCRTTFNKYQLNILENEFIQSNFVSNERIDYLVKSTDLDSRIIKNWFKNKRSRVLADTKTSSMTASKQNPASKLAKPEPPNEDIKQQQKPTFCLPKAENSSNKSLNGLFNVVHSISTDEVKTKQSEKVREPKPLLDLNCIKCCQSSKELCNCSISNQALKRLYKYSIGFNTIDFVYCYDEKYSYSHEFYNNDENGKIFFNL